MLSLILNKIKQNDRNASKRFHKMLTYSSRCIYLPLTPKSSAGCGAMLCEGREGLHLEELMLGKQFGQHLFLSKGICMGQRHGRALSAQQKLRDADAQHGDTGVQWNPCSFPLRSLRSCFGL